MANARQFMAERTAAWAKSGYTAKDYVQDGLVAMWDGIENAGWGVHDQNATVWKDLGPNHYDLTLHGNAGFDNTCFITDGLPESYAIFTPTPGSPSMIELSCDIVNFSVIIHWNLGWEGNPGNIMCSFERVGSSGYPSGKNAMSIVGGHTFTLGLGSDRTLFRDGEAAETAGTSNWQNIGPASLCVPWHPDKSSYTRCKRYRCIRAYNRYLTPDEIAANYAVDKARFNLPDAA